MTYNQQQCGTRIAAELKKRKIKQGEIARILNITDATMTAYVKGYNSIPTDLLAKIIEIINEKTPEDKITADYLIFGTMSSSMILPSFQAELKKIKETIKILEQLESQLLELEKRKKENLENPDLDIEKLKRIIHKEYSSDEELESLLIELSPATKKVILKLISLLFGGIK